MEDLSLEFRQEMQCLQEALYHEARGEPFAGQIYVGFVIKNRVASSRFSDTFCEVIKEPWQFSYNHVLGSFEMLDTKAKKSMESVAYTIMTTTLENQPIPEYVLYYHADDIQPRWDYTKIYEYASVGNHVFYADH